MPLKLDLGCSRYKSDGYIGLDIAPAADVDVLGDGRKLPFRTSSITGVYSHHCIEHIDDQLAVISELWRVCQHGAEIDLTVPHFSCSAYYDDLTHHYKYSSRSFEHYDKRMQPLTGHSIYLPEVDLRLEEVRLSWWQERTINQKSPFKAAILRLLNDAINYLANSNQFLCERIWCRWVGGFYEIQYRFRVVKEIER